MGFPERPLLWLIKTLPKRVGRKQNWAEKPKLKNIAESSQYCLKLWQYKKMYTKT